jgi:hypothetical protein
MKDLRGKISGYHITPGGGNVNHAANFQDICAKSQKKHPDFLKIRAPLLSELFSCVILQYYLPKSNSTLQIDKQARREKWAGWARVLEEWNKMR